MEIAVAKENNELSFRHIGINLKTRFRISCIDGLRAVCSKDSLVVDVSTV